jgi:hypothetical protein
MRLLQFAENYIFSPQLFAQLDVEEFEEVGLFVG